MFSQALEIVLTIAHREATSRRHTHLTLEHLLYALAHDQDGERILAACGADLPKLRRVGLRLLQRRRQHVAGLHFLPAGALDVQHGSLKHAPERERLLRFLLLPAAVLFDRIPQVLVEILPQLWKVRAARGQDSLAVLIVRQRVQQVLERQMRVTPRGCLAIGNGEHDFQCLTEHLFISTS